MFKKYHEDDAGFKTWQELKLDSRIHPLGTKNQFWINSDGAASQRQAQLA